MAKTYKDDFIKIGNKGGNRFYKESLKEIPTRGFPTGKKETTKKIRSEERQFLKNFM